MTTPIGVDTKVEEGADMEELPPQEEPKGETSDNKEQQQEQEEEIEIQVNDDDEIKVTPLITTTGATPTTTTGAAQTERKFPDVFYCPITTKIIKDPVVAPDGISYERVAIVQRGDVSDPSKLYSNRALAAVMEETIQCSGDSFRAGVMRMQKSVMKSLKQVLAKSVIPTDEYRPLPDVYYCPITLNLMHLPVIDPDGNTYEKAAILNWIQANHSSPITRKALNADDLYPNTAIASLLEEEKDKDEDSIHPSIRKFKLTNPPDLPDVEEGNPPGDGQSMPTTLEQIEDRRRARRQESSNLVGLCFFLFFLLLLLSMFPAWLVYCILILCCISAHSGREEE